MLMNLTGGSTGNRIRTQGLIGGTVESHGAEEFHTSRSDREKPRSRFLSDRQCQGSSLRRPAHRRTRFTTASGTVPEEFIGPAAPIEITSECCRGRLSATHRPPDKRSRNIGERGGRPIPYQR